MNTRRTRSSVAGHGTALALLTLLAAPHWRCRWSLRVRRVYTIQSLGRCRTAGSVRRARVHRRRHAAHRRRGQLRRGPPVHHRRGARRAGHIVGFSGSATAFGSVGEYNDGGVVFGPAACCSRRAGRSTSSDRRGPAKPTRRASSTRCIRRGGEPGRLTFVPGGMPGAGQLKIVSWDGASGTRSRSRRRRWHVRRGVGDARSNAARRTGGHRLRPPGSPLFANPSLLISEYTDGNVAVYDVDAAGNPIVATRRDFVVGLFGAEVRSSIRSPATSVLDLRAAGGDECCACRASWRRRRCGPGSLVLLAVGLAGWVSRDADPPDRAPFAVRRAVPGPPIPATAGWIRPSHARRRQPSNRARRARRASGSRAYDSCSACAGRDRPPRRSAARDRAAPRA